MTAMPRAHSSAFAVVYRARNPLSPNLPHHHHDLDPAPETQPVANATVQRPTP